MVQCKWHLQLLGDTWCPLMFPYQKAKILKKWAGLRPARNSIRLEPEVMSIQNKKLNVRLLCIFIQWLENQSLAMHQVCQLTICLSLPLRKTNKQTSQLRKWTQAWKEAVKSLCGSVHYVARKGFRLYSHSQAEIISENTSRSQNLHGPGHITVHQHFWSWTSLVCWWPAVQKSCNGVFGDGTQIWAQLA